MIPLPSHPIDWTIYERLPWFARLAGSPQDAEYHAEGDVQIHTKMVVTAALEHTWASPDHELILLAALLHDVAKPETSVFEGGRWRNPSHSPVGAIRARRILYEAGCDPHLRERVCRLVRFHQHPYHFLGKESPERHLVRLSLSCGALRPLADLARCDNIGRISVHREEALEAIELFRELAQELEVLDAARSFDHAGENASYTRRQFCLGKCDFRAVLHDDTRPEIVMLSGLPGTGKSRLARQIAEARGLEIISLDALRQETDTEDQSLIVRLARTRMRELLRERRGFVYDATNLVKRFRAEVTSLVEDYGGAVHLVAVDAPAELQRRWNRERDANVPEDAIDHMLDRWEFPDATEAQTVTHHVVTGAG